MSDLKSGDKWPDLEKGEGNPHSKWEDLRPKPDDPVVINEAGGEQSATGYRFDLLDPESMFRLGAILQEGVDKGYKKNNWMKISCDDHINHALGHIFAFILDYPDDPEDHLGHAFCRLMFAVRMSIEESK